MPIGDFIVNGFLATFLKIEFLITQNALHVGFAVCPSVCTRSQTSPIPSCLTLKFRCSMEPAGLSGSRHVTTAGGEPALCRARDPLGKRHGPGQVSSPPCGQEARVTL